jgi:tyrosine decarboxylase/aspartate 1-decarboxylase
MDKKEIIEKLREMRSQDPCFGGGKIVSSVSTEPLDVALDAWRLYSDVNALDTYIFSSAQKLEDEVMEWMAGLLHGPHAAGYITTGGTESNIAALYAAKKMHPGKKEIIVPESAHYSVLKAADLMCLRVKKTGLDGSFRADVEEIRKALSKDTLAVVATAGTASLGMVDPVEEISELCGDVFFHIDAAFGGFILPYVKGRVTDYRLDNLDSLTVDPHKMGCAPVPAGALLFRDASYLEGMAVHPAYIPITSYTLSGSRSAGAIAAVWATINYLGRGGYEKNAKECLGNTSLLCRELEKIPGAGIVTEPDLNIVGVRLDDVEKTALELKKMGWKIAVNRELSCIRFAVMPHVQERSCLNSPGT